MMSLKDTPTFSRVMDEDLQRDKRKEIIKDIEEKLEKIHDEENVKIVNYLSNDSMVPGHIVGFEDMLQSVSNTDTLYLMINSNGGDPETALRIINMFRDRSDNFRTIVPDMAKSAATQVCLGSECVYMGPNSELGPIDPQIPFNQRYTSARNLIDGLEFIENRNKNNPEVSPQIYAVIAQHFDGAKLQEAQNAIDYIKDSANEIMQNMLDDEEKRKKIITELLSMTPHSKSIPCKKAKELGIEVYDIGEHEELWNKVWELYARTMKAMQKDSHTTFWETSEDALGASSNNLEEDEE